MIKVGVSSMPEMSGRGQTAGINLFLLKCGGIAAPYFIPKKEVLDATVWRKLFPGAYIPGFLSYERR